MTEEEVIEVEVERLGEGPRRSQEPFKRLGDRLWKAFGPVLFGVLIDAGDLATFAPLSFLALPIGIVAGYFFSGFLEVSPTWRIAITILTGLYWASPLNFIPLATAIASVLQVMRPGALQKEPF